MSAGYLTRSGHSSRVFVDLRISLCRGNLRKGKDMQYRGAGTDTLISFVPNNTIDDEAPPDRWGVFGSGLAFSIPTRTVLDGQDGQRACNL